MTIKDRYAVFVSCSDKRYGSEDYDDNISVIQKYVQE